MVRILGTSGGSRTLTGPLLKRLPLPLGYARMVVEEGVEPSRPKTPVPETGASAIPPLDHGAQSESRTRTPHKEHIALNDARLPFRHLSMVQEVGLEPTSLKTVGFRPTAFAVSPLLHWYRERESNSPNPPCKSGAIPDDYPCKIGRGGQTRTDDLWSPRPALFQAELHPVGRIGGTRTPATSPL